MKLITIVALMIGATSIASARSIHDCMSTREIGRAYVDRPGFAKKIRALRSQCASAANRYEAADIVWDGSDRAYVCKVGYMCSPSGG